MPETNADAASDPEHDLSEGNSLEEAAKSGFGGFRNFGSFGSSSCSLGLRPGDAKAAADASLAQTTAGAATSLEHHLGEGTSLEEAAKSGFSGFGASSCSLAPRPYDAEAAAEAWLRSLSAPALRAPQASPRHGAPRSLLGSIQPAPAAGAGGIFG